MKKIITAALLSFAVALAPLNYALGADESSTAAQRVKIGVAASVQGSVRITGENRGIVKSGMEIFLNDRVITGRNGSLQILLLDETVFTLGPNSDMVIDKFVYDPATNNGQVGSKITKGVFRFITGKVARKDPTKMNVNIKGGNIGIRGTIVTGSTGENGSTVILAGPGARNNAGERPGAVYVSGTGDNAGSGSEGANGYYLNTPGEGTYVSSDGIVEKPRMMQDELSELNGVLDNKNDEQNDDDDDGTDIDDDQDKKENKDKKEESAKENKEEESSKDENSSGDGKSDEGSSNDSSSSVEDSGDDVSGKSEESEQDSNLNDQSGQNDADKQSDANENQERESGVTDVQTSITQTTQDSTVEKTAENIQTPVIYGDLPNLGISRAEYSTDSIISAKDADGNPIVKENGTTLVRGLSLKTIFNFVDKYFQQFYIAMLSEDRLNVAADNNIEYRKAGGSSYQNSDPAKFTLTGTLANNLSYTDPDLGSKAYGDFTADLQFFKTLSNPLPTLTADITVETSSSAVFAGSYEMSGVLYAGTMTGNEMGLLAAKLPSAIFNAQGKVANADSAAPYPFIGVNMLAKADFENRTISDMVMTLTPENDSAKNGMVTYYSEGTPVEFSITSGEGYKETKADIYGALTAKKINGLAVSNNDITLKYDSYNPLYATINNYYAPTMTIQNLQVNVSTDSGSAAGFDYIQETISGGIYAGSGILTKNEFDRTSALLVSAGLPKAQYSFESAPLPNSYGTDAGFTAEGFSMAVDFENKQVQDMQFSIKNTSLEVDENITQASPVSITGLFGSGTSGNASVGIGTPYTTSNVNAYAGALLATAEENLDIESGQTGSISNVQAEVYFKRADNSAYPGVGLFLGFDYSDSAHPSHDGSYGTYDEDGAALLSLIGSTYKVPETPVTPTTDLIAAYYTKGTFENETDSSAEVYGAEFVTAINLTSNKFMNATAILYSREDSADKKAYINSDSDAALSDDTATLTLSATPDQTALPDAPVTLSAEISLDRENTRLNSDDLDVPSISVALDAPDNTYHADMYAYYDPDYYTGTFGEYDMSLIKLSPGQTATWAKWTNTTTDYYDTSYEQHQLPVYNVLDNSVNLSLDSSNNNALTLSASYLLKLSKDISAGYASFSTAVNAATIPNIPLTESPLTGEGTAYVKFVNAGGSPDLIVDLDIDVYHATIAHSGFTVPD